VTLPGVGLVEAAAPKRAPPPGSDIPGMVCQVSKLKAFPAFGSVPVAVLTGVLYDQDLLINQKSTGK
jgi:hypothetical protein